METTKQICPFMSSGQAIILCVDGKLELPSNTKDLIRKQAQGQLVDFALLTPSESCKAWQDGNCLRLISK